MKNNKTNSNSKRYKLHKILRDCCIEVNPREKTIKIPKGSPYSSIDAVIKLIAEYDYRIL